MNNKKFVGTFPTIETVLYKVVELKSKGYSESDIDVFSREEDNISMLRDQTEVELHGSYGKDWFKGLHGMLGVSEVSQNIFSEMGFTDGEAKHYYDEIENGGIALFVLRH